MTKQLQMTKEEEIISEEKEKVWLFHSVKKIF